MKKLSSFSRRSTALLSAAILGLSAAVPILMNTLPVSAANAQLGARSITMSSSKTSATNVMYTVSFTVKTTGAIQGIVIDFCDATAGQGPLLGTICSTPTGINTNKATLSINNQTNITGFTVDTTNSTANKVVLTNASGASVAANAVVSFDLGVAGTNGFTNPSTLGFFYARMVTYSTPAGATAYSSGTVNANNPGTYVDGGGDALSTANQLTTTARVQEQLEFCVAATDTTIVSNGTAPANCSSALMTTSTTVDMGVVDGSLPVAGTINATPVPSGNNRNGGFLIRTNASGGATVSYKAEQDASTGTNKGSLKVATANCGTPSANTDQCFNSAGAAKVAFAASTEKFGFILPTAKFYRPGPTATTNLVGSGAYVGTGLASDGFAFVDSGTVTQMASTGGSVCDYEFATIEFAAVAGATTPTGSYTLLTTYIATSTF